MVKYADIDARYRRANNLNMTIVEITGGTLRAARSLTGLSGGNMDDDAPETQDWVPKAMRWP